jgi:hypothetical protein
MKKRKAPRFVTVAILTTITVVFWVFYGLYNILTSTPPVNVPPEILAPIDPTLNKKALDNIQNRIFFEENEAEMPLIPQAPSPTPEEGEEETTEVTPTINNYSCIRRRNRSHPHPNINAIR